ncbi:hypothetical protein SORBI_3005G026966 [Sorghum bicolor]|uniref:Uncharacterized protein n=1 Tax=Sorghum bicolor TaxID=4558 RepID=A0A1Z5RHJ1_SORBI|nr:hypothetical protein SORBI_3005G026966 [Sorghum bicolor]
MLADCGGEKKNLTSFPMNWEICIMHHCTHYQHIIWKGGYCEILREHPTDYAIKGRLRCYSLICKLIPSKGT